MEISSQMDIAEELGYITTDERLSVDKLIVEEVRILSGLKKSFN